MLVPVRVPLHSLLCFPLLHLYCSFHVQTKLLHLLNNGHFQPYMIYPLQKTWLANEEFLHGVGIVLIMAYNFDLKLFSSE